MIAHAILLRRRGGRAALRCRPLGGGHPDQEQIGQNADHGGTDAERNQDRVIAHDLEQLPGQQAENRGPK